MDEVYLLPADWAIRVEVVPVGPPGTSLTTGYLVGSCRAGNAPTAPPGFTFGRLVAVDRHGAEWDVPKAIVVQTVTDSDSVHHVHAETVGPFARRVDADTPTVVTSR